jgi:hypothetical protein
MALLSKNQKRVKRNSDVLGQPERIKTNGEKEVKKSKRNLLQEKKKPVKRVIKRELT